MSLRHRVSSTGADVLADVVGLVTASDGSRLRVERADGTAVSVRADRVVAWRGLPAVPSRVRATDVAALERLAAAGWPAAETEPLGGWLLRAAGGWTRRANSVLALGHPGLPLPRALDACAAWYAARGLPPLVCVVTAAAGGPAVASEPAAGEPDLQAGEPDLQAGLEALGWVVGVRNAVLTARTADVLAGLAGLAGSSGLPGTDPGVGLPSLDEHAPADWLADYRDAATHPAAREVLAGPGAPARVRFATARQPGEGGPEVTLLARGRAVTLGGWTGLAAVAVTRGRRRAGIGSALVAALLLDGLRHGGVRTYVQVEVENAGAREFWRRLGYRPSHATAYLGPPEPAGRSAGGPPRATGS